MPSSTSLSYCCYCLISEKNPKATYFGCTNNLKHRLRQHNGEIKGGARSTHANRPWTLWYYITGFGDNKKKALRFEWFVKFSHKHKLLSKMRCSNRIKRLYMTLNALGKVDPSTQENLKINCCELLTKYMSFLL